MNPEKYAIQISADLYRELRQYCDDSGIRFLDFIEDALEKAAYRDELEQLTRDEFEIRKKIAAEKALSLKHGFSLGVMAATLNLVGLAGLGESLTPQEAREVLKFKAVEGEQMKLFDF